LRFRELLPIVIVFVGAENMFSLVDAVTRTSVTLPVKQRIALGLSHAGTSNTLKVVSYNAILGVVAVLVGDAGAGAIRQFCVFAIVVLVAHWFLAHTFFLAVLSIDIQRLELDELLRQNANLAPNDGVEERRPHSFSHSRWQGFILAKQNFFRRRVTKDISMVLVSTYIPSCFSLRIIFYCAASGNIDVRMKGSGLVAPKRQWAQNKTLSITFFEARVTV
jgi:hypothetical protein